MNENIQIPNLNPRMRRGEGKDEHWPASSARGNPWRYAQFFIFVWITIYEGIQSCEKNHLIFIIIADPD